MPVKTRDAVGHPDASAGPNVTAAAQSGWTVTSLASTNDEAGTVATTAASSTAAGAVAIVTFANAYPAAPKAVLVSGQLSPFVSSVTAAGFTINTSSTSSATNNTAYNFAYEVVP